MRCGTEGNATTPTASTALSGVPTAVAASTTVKNRKKMSNNSFIPVVIPYLASAAQGNELELAVTGWRKHFDTPYHIYIVGDPHPVISTGDDIDLIRCPKVGCEKGSYQPNVDIANKLFTFCMECMDNDIPGFVYTCDDIYPVNDFTIAEIAFPKVTGGMSERDAEEKDGWWGAYQRTRRTCVEEGLGTWDWVCHLPVLFETGKFAFICQNYDCHTRSHVFENLYFNTFDKDRIPLVLDGHDNLKYEVSTNPLDSFGFDKALKNKIFITNTNSGWSPELEERLRKHYNNQ